MKRARSNSFRQIQEGRSSSSGRITSPIGQTEAERDRGTQVMVKPAVDGERLAGHVAARVAGEEDQRGGQLLGVADAAGDDPLELALHVLLAELVAHLRLEEAGRERVDADPLAARPLLGEVAREPDQARPCSRSRPPAAGPPVVSPRTLEMLMIELPGSITVAARCAIQ